MASATSMCNTHNLTLARSHRPDAHELDPCRGDGGGASGTPESDVRTRRTTWGRPGAPRRRRRPPGRTWTRRDRRQNVPSLTPFPIL
jgi:hypothetical protein